MSDKDRKIAIKFDNVSKIFYKKNNKKQIDKDKKIAVSNISFDIYDGEFITILGSSGSGKSTIIKMINKLIDISSGNIFFYNKNIKDMDEIELRRQIGYVVQDIGLFPHMTVEKNISVVPELLKWNINKIKNRVKELLELIELDYKEYKDKYPHQLSGGQKQRVGVARALATKPRVMLLDEPFGAIDAITRMSLQQELLKIHKRIGGTFIFITHDINEALLLGERVIIMHNSEICQFDKPKKILQNPKTDFVKNLLNTIKEQNKFWREII